MTNLHIINRTKRTHRAPIWTIPWYRHFDLLVRPGGEQVMDDRYADNEKMAVIRHIERCSLTYRWDNEGTE